MLDPVRLIHSTTDLQKAHILITRLRDGEQREARTRRLLEAAFLAEYARPFTPRAEESAPVELEALHDQLTAEQERLHELLLSKSADQAEQIAAGRLEDGATAPFPLERLDLSAIEALVYALRVSVTKSLYPQTRDDEDALRGLVGPLR